MKFLFQNSYVFPAYSRLQFCVLLALFLCFAFFSCSSEEEEAKPDCDSINRDVDAIVSKYRSCDSDADCFFWGIASECIRRCGIGLNITLINFFEEEIRLLKKQCIHVNQRGKNRRLTCRLRDCPLVLPFARCVSNQCKSYE